MIELNDYKNLIDLNQNKKYVEILSFDEEEKIVDELLLSIQQNFKVKIDFSTSYQQKRLWLRGLLNQIPPFNFGERFFELQNKLLSSDTIKKQIVMVDNLQFKNNISVFQGDITTLKVDAIVNAGNSALLGCFVPLHSCIDNIIISSAGFQVRNDLNIIMKKQGHQEPNGNAKITSAYNLPSKYIIHTVGPCVFGNLSKKDEEELADCYKSCLNLAKEMNLKSIAFCCISTGEFRFPKERACEIATQTVKDWLAKSNYYINVVFDVFEDEDRDLYLKKLNF